MTIELSADIFEPNGGWELPEDWRQIEMATAAAGEAIARALAPTPTLLEDLRLVTEALGATEMLLSVPERLRPVATYQRVVDEAKQAARQSGGGRASLIDSAADVVGGIFGKKDARLDEDLRVVLDAFRQTQIELAIAVAAEHERSAEFEQELARRAFEVFVTGDEKVLGQISEQHFIARVDVERERLRAMETRPAEHADAIVQTGLALGTVGIFEADKVRKKLKKGRVPSEASAAIAASRRASDNRWAPLHGLASVLGWEDLRGRLRSDRV